MNLVEFVDPACLDIADVSTESFSELVKSGARYHIAVLVRDDRREHSSPGTIFGFGYFAEKMSKSWIMVVDLDC